MAGAISTKYRVVAIGALLLALGSTSTLSLASRQGKKDSGAMRAWLIQEVRHQLVMLPYYSIYDNLSFEVKGSDTVVLSGQATRPGLKSDAESAALRLEGVAKVINEIEVLPFSPSDDRIRIAVFRALWSEPGLERYLARAVSPIHIVVKNGNVTLVGIVATPMDKNLAGLAANGVPGTFSVKNDLKVEKE